uniref:Protein, containing ALMS motif n=1 Tax=Rhipicephalus zambeziensis TaxID=60191 RepID=A0A224YPL4_9ACAR
MAMELPLTTQSSYQSAFFFPLCYATPEAKSDSETSAFCENHAATLRTSLNTLDCSDPGVCSRSLCSDTAISSPSTPSTNQSLEHKLGNEYTNLVLKKFLQTLQQDSMEPTDGYSQSTSYSAPPALMSASRGTSIASSFSSESIPVVTTSQGSTEHGSSSCTMSGTVDGEAQSCTEKVLEQERAASSSAFCPGTCLSASDAVVASKYDTGKGNLMNNQELALSLESVLTVVPQSLRVHSTTANAKSLERKQVIKEPCVKTSKPRYSTSSCGGASLQSWDSHLEIDASIEDIVESVIHELSICETELQSCSGIFSQEHSTISDAPRRASPASLSSYTSSKRLEWDNGADIGYSGTSGRTHEQGGSRYRNIARHISEPSESDVVNEASVSPDEKAHKFAAPHSRDVIVQTEACSIKDAGVQANASATDLSSTQTHVKASINQSDMLVSGSAATDLSSIASTKQGSSIISLANSAHQQTSMEKRGFFVTDRAPNYACANLKRTVQQPAGRKSLEMPKRDRANSVSLCYSHKTFKEHRNLRKKHAGSTRKRASDFSHVQRRHCSNNFVAASDTSHMQSEPLDVTGFTVINNNRMKMKLPTTVPGLASRSATPAELPRACCELNKRRLDHWLSSGFPYVPAVVPLEVDILPRIHSAEPATEKQENCDPRLVVSGSCLPSITQMQEAIDMANTRSTVTAQGAGGMTRKRYIVRPASRSALKTSEASTLLSKQTAGLCQKLITKDKLGMSSLTKMDGIPPINGAAKSTLLSQSNTEDTLLSRSNESEACSSAEILASCENQEEHCQHNSSASCNSLSEGTSSQLLTVNGKSCKLKRMAHRELEKLRFLVNRQRHGYLKQLQREVERLHKLEQLFLLADVSRTASSAETETTSPEKDLAGTVCRNGDSNSVAVQTSQSLFTSCDDEDTVVKERCFVSVVGQSVKKQRDHPSQQRRKAVSRRPVAWVVPVGLNTPYRGSKQEGASSKERNHQDTKQEESLQAAFAAHCSRLIKRSEARQTQLAILAERRQKQRLAPLQVQLQGRNQLHPHPPGNLGKASTKKTFTHKEMREQTERVYQKLPEVIDSKTRLHREQQYRTNRLMAQLYNKAIQEKALIGCVNFPINKPFTHL